MAPASRPGLARPISIDHHMELRWKDMRRGETGRHTTCLKIKINHISGFLLFSLWVYVELCLVISLHAHSLMILLIFFCFFRLWMFILCFVPFPSCSYFCFFHGSEYVLQTYILNIRLCPFCVCLSFECDTEH